MEVSGCLGKRKLNTGTVGFVLAPRINAAGRLERAMMAVEMLTTDDAVRAQQIALELDRCNARRQEIERQIQDEARAMIEASGGVADRRSIVLAGPGWHPGVIGIVAGRLAEIYHRPTIVLAQGETIAQGSARSIAGFDLYEALKDCSGPLLILRRARRRRGPETRQRERGRLRPALRGALPQLAHARAARAGAPRSTPRSRSPRSRLRVVEELDRLEPYGIGNPKPLLVASRLQVVGQPRVVGDQKNHLQLRVRQGDVIMKAIGWNMAERGQVLEAGCHCSLVFHPSINEWNNRREVQLEIRDFSLDAQAAVAEPPDRRARDTDGLNGGFHLPGG